MWAEEAKHARVKLVKQATRALESALAAPKARPTRPRRRAVPPSRPVPSSFPRQLNPVCRTIVLESSVGDGGAEDAGSGGKAWSDAASEDDAFDRQRAAAPRGATGRKRKAEQSTSGGPASGSSGARPAVRTGCLRGRGQAETIVLHGVEFVVLKKSGVASGLSLPCFACCGQNKHLYWRGTDVDMDTAACRLISWACDCPGEAALHRRKGGPLCVQYA